MNNRLKIALIASTLALGFIGAAAATEQVSGHNSPTSAQQAGFMPVPLCPPTAPTCPLGGPYDQIAAQAR